MSLREKDRIAINLDTNTTRVEIELPTSPFACMVNIDFPTRAFLRVDEIDELRQRLTWTVIQFAKQQQWEQLGARGEDGPL